MEKDHSKIPAKEMLPNEVNFFHSFADNLLKMNESWQKMFDAVPDAIILVDNNMKIQLANLAFCQMVKLPKEKIIGKHCYQIIHGRAALHESCPHQEACRKNASHFSEFIEPHLGSHFHFSVLPLFNDKGEIQATIEVIRDISLQKQQEAKLHEATNQWAVTFDLMPDLILILDRERKIVKANRAVLTKLNKEKNDVIGKFCYEIMHGTEEPPHFCPHHKTIVDKKEHYNDLFDPHLKGYFHFSTTPLLNEAGEIEMVVEVARDITSIKLAEEDLRIKENALASSLSGFAMASMDAKLSYVNDSFLKIWGYNNLNEILGRSALEFWEKAEEAQNMISALSANGEWSGEMKGLKKDGTKIDVQLQANLVKNEQGEPICLFSSFMDITKRKKVEADLLIYARELEASNNLKDLFSDIISHDLLNPAGVIKNFMEFLLEDETQEEKIEILERTHHSSLKLIKIIEEAQIYSRLKTMDKFETNAMDLLFLIKDAIEEYRQILKKQEIQVILPLPGNYMAWVNPLLGNVFSNIISNSIKYAGDGKKIEVEIQDEGESFKISFKDYGLGIPPAYRKKLFERFFRLEEENIKGLGLGLAITRYLVALHKGQIWIEDNPAGGSIFFVRIPKEAGFGEGIGINPSRL